MARKKSSWTEEEFERMESIWARQERFAARVEKWRRRRWAIMRRALGDYRARGHSEWIVRRLHARDIPTLNRGEYWVMRRWSLLEGWERAVGRDEIQ